MQANDMWTQRRTILGSVGELRAGSTARMRWPLKRSNEVSMRRSVSHYAGSLNIGLYFHRDPGFTLATCTSLGSLYIQMERAATGQLDVWARVVGDDEMGDMGKRFNTMLERLGTFDRLKRDRIYEDGARIHFSGTGSTIRSPYSIQIWPLSMRILQCVNYSPCQTI